MPSIPLPFVIALMLLLLLGSLARQDNGSRPVFLILIAACILQSVLLGLRWGYGVEWVRPILPITAAAGPALVYASFGGLARREGPQRWLHALPPLFVVLLVLFWRSAIDVALLVIFLGYAAALFALAWSGPDGLGRARLEGATPAHRAMLLAATALVASALTDLLVAIDLERSSGAHAALIVAIANLGGLIAIGFAGLVGGSSQPQTDMAAPLPEPPAINSEEDAAILSVIEALMANRHLFRDPELSLDRLARRAGITARRISGAINRVHGQNVSQYVNDHRVAEACLLLAGTDRSVTEIMLDVGFLTKSNFNREFRRVTGTSPSAWRISTVTRSPETVLSKSPAMR